MKGDIIVLEEHHRERRDDCAQIVEKIKNKAARYIITWPANRAAANQNRPGHC